MIRINAPWVDAPYPRINTGIDWINSDIDSPEEEEVYQAPFSLFIDSVDEDEELCYVGVRPALVNDLVPIIELPDNTDSVDVEINAEETPLIAVALEGSDTFYLNLELTRESSFDDFAITRATISKVNSSLIDDTDTLIFHSLVLGYVSDGVATSYHSTSLNAEVCEETATVWAV